MKNVRTISTMEELCINQHNQPCNADLTKKTFAPQWNLPPMTFANPKIINSNAYLLKNMKHYSTETFKQQFNRLPEKPTSFVMFSNAEFTLWYWNCWQKCALLSTLTSGNRLTLQLGVKTNHEARTYAMWN